MEPVPAATDFVAAHFPDALVALLGGSVLTPERTPTSDLDLVVLLDGPPAPFRETFRHDGWVVEAFVQTRESLAYFSDRDVERRVPSLLRMCADSTVLVDRAGLAESIQAEARRRLSAGPPPLDPARRDQLRYTLTDQLDDLAGCRADDELPHIAALLLTGAAELALAAGGAWAGTGKGLQRSLVRHDPGLAQGLVDAHRQAVDGGARGPLREVVLEVLDRAGGKLLEGYRVAGPAARTGPAAADVLLVTCTAVPEGEVGGHLLVEALAARGLAARWVAWDDPAVDWSAARAVAVRSTWDYEERRDDFLSWAHGVGPTLLNGADVFAWNTDKSYLLDLATAGLPVVPSALAKTEDEVAAAVAPLGRAVVKPAVGAGGRDVVVIDRPGGHPHGEGPWLVQPLVESVRTEGEISVFVLGGRAVAQVRKRPGGDEVRVHEEYGGRSEAEPLADEHAALAAEAVRVAEDRLGANLAYARADLMRLADGTLAVGELEVTEPGLYLDLVPEVAAAFADTVAGLLR
jgi:hypothetical protein